MVPRQGGFLTRLLNPAALPPWLTEADIDFYAAEFARTGFRGGLNWYRNIDRNWELLAPFVGAKVTTPALYVAGDRDLVVRFRGMDQLIPNLTNFVPQLRKTIMLPGCGHWTQHKRLTLRFSSFFAACRPRLAPSRQALAREETHGSGHCHGIAGFSVRNRIGSRPKLVRDQGGQQGRQTTCGRGADQRNQEVLQGQRRWQQRKTSFGCRKDQLRQKMPS
jgi:hypothetical protein